MNTITTTQRGNRISRAIRRWWLQQRINMIEDELELFRREASFLPLHIDAYERLAGQLRVEKITLQD